MSKRNVRFVLDSIDFPCFPFQFSAFAVEFVDFSSSGMSAINDLAIQSLIMEKTDSTMSKLSKYEMLAEKLIEGRIDGEVSAEHPKT